MYQERRTGGNNGQVGTLEGLPWHMGYHCKILVVDYSQTQPALLVCFGRWFGWYIVCDIEDEDSSFSGMPLLSTIQRQEEDSLDEESGYDDAPPLGRSRRAPEGLSLEEVKPPPPIINNSAMLDGEDNIVDEEATDYAALEAEVVHGLLRRTSLGDWILCECVFAKFLSTAGYDMMRNSAFFLVLYKLYGELPCCL
jgi:hypothetical protein